MTPTSKLASLDDLSHLRRHLQQAVEIGDTAFSQRIKLTFDDHLAFMAVNFTAKQVEHGRSILILGNQMDAVLIARSMFEGLSQLLWAWQLPDERPLRWRTFAYVRDWRTMQEQAEIGIQISPERRAFTEEGIRKYGDLFLSDKARKAQAKGQPLPEDPYAWNWYGEKEKEVFGAVGGQLAYERLYGPFSEWHHWRVGGFGALLSFDETASTFRMTAQNPQFTASALSSGFQCLWQTLDTLRKIVPAVQMTGLDEVYRSYIAAGQSGSA